MSDDNRRMETQDHYFKSPDAMCELFADIPEAIENTVVIAKRCLFHLKKRKPELPAFATEAGRFTDESRAGPDHRMVQRGLKADDLP